MKRFRFSLEKVEKLREQAKKEAELALAVVNGKLMEAENSLAQLAAHESRTRSERYTGTALDMLRTQHYLLRLSGERDALLERVAALNLELELKREAWIKARAEHRALEKLREKKAGEQRKENLGLEVQALDEVANSRLPDRGESPNR